MRVGFTYDAVDDYVPAGDVPADYYGEFDSEETIAAIAQGLAGDGREVVRIGRLEALIDFLTEGGQVDIVFNIAEGVWGRSREAQVPALLEAFRLPYTGSDPLTLAVSLDKAMTKHYWQRWGLPTADFGIVATMAELEQVQARLPAFPLFVKPLHEGSSKGISADSVVSNAAELSAQVDKVLLTYREPVLVEEYLPGPEYTAALLGTGATAQVLGLVRIANGVNGFEEKRQWQAGTFVPVDSPGLRKQLEELALEAYRSIGCRDLGRVDIRLDREGYPQLVEINPLPGLSPVHSAVPAIARKAGLAHEQLIGRILQSAIDRYSL